ncbi:MAG: glycerophosphodiester phosphodiesterase [Anaerolineae bacterium]
MREDYYARPLVFGHRGASAAAPENTLAAFELAAEMGADGVELDAQLSQDGEVVICHDFFVDKTTNTHGRVDSFTAAELRALDAGSWFSPAFAGQYIPTLRELFERLGRRLLFNVELKSESLRDNGLERRVAGLIHDFDLYDRVIVSSFNPAALWRMRRLDPRIDLGLLYYDEQPLHLRRAWARYIIPFQAMHPYYPMVDEQYMTWARRRGYKVNVWTVDDEEEARRLLRLGVNIIITNHPDVMRKVAAETVG